MKHSASQSSFIGPQDTRRIADILVSCVLLILASPLLVLIAVAIKSVSPLEPVIFRQRRLGLRGEEFWIYKFRTIAGSEDVSDIEKKLYHWLRRLSLDELPQLLNVLAGTMTLVGPRPLVKRDAMMRVEYRDRRLQVKPGMTGWWQCRIPIVISIEQKLALDCEYVEHRSFFLDAAIVVQTILVILYKPFAKELWTSGRSHSSFDDAKGLPSIKA